MKVPDLPSEKSLTLVSNRHRVLSLTRLLNGWSPVDRVHYLQEFRDGTVHEDDRDLNARRDGVTVLLRSLERGTVLLLRQPRIVATLRGDSSGETLEACSGLLDGDSPEECAREEALQETGYEALNLTPVASVYASPGGSLELIHLFTADYTEASHPGGGLRSEGEDIEVIEMTLDDALTRVSRGEIRDGRTILLLQHAALEQFRSSAQSRASTAGRRLKLLKTCMQVPLHDMLMTDVTHLA